MKQNTEEPDYRSMNEVQLKYELIRLEKMILDITGVPVGRDDNRSPLGLFSVNRITRRYACGVFRVASRRGG